jgi:hypothetical protein
MIPLDPPPDRDLPTGRLEQRRAHLVRELRGAKKRGRRALRGLMIVPGIAVLGVGAAWAAGVFDGRITEPEAVECYAGPEPDRQAHRGLRRLRCRPYQPAGPVRAVLRARLPGGRPPGAPAARVRRGWTRLGVPGAR